MKLYYKNEHKNVIKKTYRL